MLLTLLGPFLLLFMTCSCMLLPLLDTEPSLKNTLTLSSFLRFLLLDLWLLFLFLSRPSLLPRTTWSPSILPTSCPLGRSASSLFSAPPMDSSPEMVLSPSTSLAESLGDFAFVFLGFLCFLPETGALCYS